MKSSTRRELGRLLSNIRGRVAHVSAVKNIVSCIMAVLKYTCIYIYIMYTYTMHIYMFYMIMNSI